METRTILTLIGFVVVLFGYIAVHRLTDWRSKRAELRSDIVIYKSAFAPEISAISNNSFAMDTFPIAFSRHESAVDAIRFILPKRYQRKLQEAWDEYQGKGSGLDGEDFVAACNASLYSTDQELFKSLKKRFQVLHGCLDKLL